MRGQPGFFDLDDRLKWLSDLGDQLETFRSAVDFSASQIVQVMQQPDRIRSRET